MKHEKRSYFETYIEPLCDLLHSFWWTILACFGWWYCRGCEKMHSPRVKKYGKRANFNLGYQYYLDVCSLHKPQKEGAQNA